jgi:site-specific recombinase XerD
MKISKLVKGLKLGFAKWVRRMRGPKRAPSKKRSRKLAHSESPLLELHEKLPNPRGADEIELKDQAPAISIKNHWEGPALLQSFAEFSTVQLSPHTQRAYQNDLKDFLVYLRGRGFEGPDALGRVTPIDVAQFRGFLIHQKKLGRNSVTRKIAVLKSFYKWAVAQHWVDRNPAELVKAFPQSQDSKTGFLNEAEVGQLLSYLDEKNPPRLSEHLRSVVLETLLLLGLRRSEAAKIRLGHLELSDEQWLLRVQGKGERERLLPIPPRLLVRWMEWLRRIIPDEELPFPGESTHDGRLVDSSLAERRWMDFFKKYSDQPLLVSTRAKSFDQAISTSEIGHLVRKTSRKAGLKNRVSPHMLRATAITHALDAGASHRGIQQMAGWTSPLMISRYDKRRNDPRFSAIYSLKYADWPKDPPKLAPDLDRQKAAEPDSIN